MSLRNVFLVAGLALTVGTGASASDQFAEDLVFNTDQMAALSTGALVEASTPSSVEDQGVIAAIEAAAAAEWAMSESADPSASIAQSESSVQDLSTAQSGSLGLDPSALVRGPVDVQPTSSSDQTKDLRAFLNAREAELQSA